MPLHDPAILEALQQQPLRRPIKASMSAHDAVDSILQRGTAAGMKSTAARAAFSAEAVEIGHRLDRHAPGRREEPGEAIGERMDIGIVPVPAGEAAVQHPLWREADHLDQPVDDDALAAIARLWPSARVSGTTPR